MWSSTFFAIRITTFRKMVLWQCMPRRQCCSAWQRRSLRRMRLVCLLLSCLVLSCVLFSCFVDADQAVSQTPAFRARFGTLDALLQRCLTAAITMATGRQAQALVTVHLVAFADITLHRPFIPTYGPSRRRCAEAALGVVRVLDRMGEVGNHSPIYAVRLSVHVMQDDWTLFFCRLCGRHCASCCTTKSFVSVHDRTQIRRAVARKGRWWSRSGSWWAC
jgi:hypothetical protein